MFEPQSFIIQESNGQKPDDLGGLIADWQLFKVVEGYMDLLTGTNESLQQNAFVEESTHILLIPDFTDGITDAMRVVDTMNRYYTVTYADDPLNTHHHNEVYVKFEGVLDGAE